MKKHNKVIWCNNGWFPFQYGFCPNKKAWGAEMRKLKMPNEPYPDVVAMCTAFRHERGDLLILVTIRDDAHKAFGKLETLGYLTHEATHVWQHMRDHIKEKTPSPEFEAYAIQTISMNLWKAFLHTRKIAK